MNATTWNYFVPYETDVSVALERLREEVFGRGDYKYSAEVLPTNVVIGALAIAARDGDANFLSEAEGRDWDSPPDFEVEDRPRPRSIRELLDQQGRTGTHSILDITSLFPRPRRGAISPFPRSKLFELFGTDAPNREEIEEAWTLGRFQNFFHRRGQGIYLIVYRDGSPDEIFFAGCSGD